MDIDQKVFKIMICNAPLNIPKIRLPLDGESRPEDSWSLTITSSTIEKTWELTIDSVSGGTACCEPDGTAFLSQVHPGLHELRISLFRHQRRKLYQSVWLWIDLTGHRPGYGFEFSAFPANLRETDCRGFQIHSASIRHCQDSFRKHWLSFDVGDRVKQFCWTQQGIFLESLEKRAGQLPSPVSHELGQTFSASTDSDRWLRIWCVPATKAELLVNGEPKQRMRMWGRSYFELSLADLSTTYPEVGEVSLRGYGEDVCTTYRERRSYFFVIWFSFAQLWIPRDRL